MKNHLLWLRCLPWHRHGLKFMPSAPVPTWCDYKWTYGQTQAPTKSRFKTPETLINTLLTRLYQERHSPDEAEFPLLPSFLITPYYSFNWLARPWGLTEEHKVWQVIWNRRAMRNRTQGLASQLKEDHKFLDTNESFRDSDIPQTTIFIT